MSLIKCPECEKEMSDKAKKCPHCGYNSSVGAVLPESVTIEFMNGTKQVISNSVFWHGNNFYDGGLFED